MFGKTKSFAQIFPYQIDVANEPYVRIRTSDGYCVSISKRAAVQCPVFRDMPQQEYELGCPLGVAEVFVRYLYYKLRYSASSIQGEICPFGDIPQELAAEVLQLSAKMQV